MSGLKFLFIVSIGSVAAGGDFICNLVNCASKLKLYIHDLGACIRVEFC